MMSEIHPLRVVGKALAIFVVLNLVYAAIDPPVGRLSIYNWLVKGRERLPRGGPQAEYNLAPEDLNAAFAAHVISAGAQDPGEYRVVVLGDSSLWGPLLSPSENLIGQLNEAHLSICGRQVRFFNLGYPGTNVLKDFILLSKAREYRPDLVIWMLAHTSLDIKVPPPVWGKESSEMVLDVLHQYGLDRYQKYIVATPNFWERTLVGQRSQLARLALLQADGLLWAATGIDQSRRRYKPVAGRFVAVPSSVPDQASTIRTLNPATHAFDVIPAARQMMRSTPVLIVNEPIFLAIDKSVKDQKKASDLRRTYEQYRRQLKDATVQAGWRYVDLSDLVPPRDFTNSIYHLNAAGERRIVGALSPEILSIGCR